MLYPHNRYVHALTSQLELALDCIEARRTVVYVTSHKDYIGKGRIKHAGILQRLIIKLDRQREFFDERGGIFLFQSGHSRWPWRERERRILSEYYMDRSSSSSSSVIVRPLSRITTMG